MNATAGTTKMQHALTFGAHEVKTITSGGQLWMSAREVGQALEYANPDAAVSKLYGAHSDEFTPTMTKIIKVMTAGGMQAVRFFSLRGAHLIAMFARTPVAKAFRVWVLDILDREVESLRVLAAQAGQLDEATRVNVEGLCNHMAFLHSWWRRVYPGLRQINEPLAAKAHDRFGDGSIFASVLVKKLGLKSWKEYADGYPWDGTWSDVEDYRRRMGKIT
ncbi:Bro-N domain-containing protein [Massilia sp. X63]|uniref:BRO-N domain-containing protein n=1 Tax=Massilia sp. X63 TaxID=3237285 RepID=UPI0034DD86AA